MQRVEIKHHATVKVELTAEDWELFTNTEPAQCLVAAKALNRAVELMVNRGAGRAATHKAVWNVMQQYSHLGACDSEPVRLLDQLLNEIYP